MDQGLAPAVLQHRLSKQSQRIQVARNMTYKDSMQSSLPTKPHGCKEILGMFQGILSGQAWK